MHCCPAACLDGHRRQVERHQRVGGEEEVEEARDLLL
jgi:hypothetical protein